MHIQKGEKNKRVLRGQSRHLSGGVVTKLGGLSVPSVTKGRFPELSVLEYSLWSAVARKHQSHGSFLEMKVSDGRQEVTQILLMVESLVWLMQPRQFEHKKKVFYELLKRGKNDSEGFFYYCFWLFELATQQHTRQWCEANSAERRRHALTSWPLGSEMLLDKRLVQSPFSRRTDVLAAVKCETPC